MPPQAIFFDLEGTLVQVKVDDSKVVEFLKAELRRRDPEGEAAFEMAHGLAETLSQAEGKVDRSAMQEIRDSVSSKLAEAEKASAASAKARKDANAAISSLQGRGIKAWAITSLSAQGAKEVLRQTSLEEIVSVAASRDDSMDVAGRIAAALEKTGSKPDGVILVADSPLDVAAARSAGLRCFAVFSPEVPVNRILESKPDALLYSIGELGDTLLFFEGKEQSMPAKPEPEQGASQAGSASGATHAVGGP